MNTEPPKHLNTVIFNEYTLFLLLEEERNKALRNVYKKKRSTKMPKGKALSELNIPPRYQHLDLSTDWFICRLYSPSPIQDSQVFAQIWGQLDQITLTFLNRLVTMLKHMCCNTRKTTNMFQALVWETQGVPVSLSTLPRGTHDKQAAAAAAALDKPKKDLGSWFDDWFQNPSPGPDSAASKLKSPPRQEAHLGNRFEQLIRSSKIAPLQSDPLGDNMSQEQRYQEVDMTDDEIRQMWQETKGS